MNRVLLGVIFGLTSSLLVGCSSGSSGGGSSSSLNGAYVALKNNLPSGGEGISSLGLSRAVHADFANTNWPVYDSNNNPLSNQTGAHYIESLVDEGRDHSVLDSVRNSLMIACFLDMYGPKEGGKLKVGNGQIVKMKLSWANSACPGASYTMASLFEMAGQIGNIIDSNGEIPLTMNVADISSTSGGIYDRSIEMPGADNPQFGGTDQTMRLKVDGRDVTFSHDETDPGNGNARYTSYIKYVASPEKIVFQHTHVGGGHRAYRFYIDDTTDEAALLSYLVNGSSKIATVLTSKPSDLSSGNLSQSYESYENSAGGGTDANDQNGCINFNTGAFEANGFGAGACVGHTQINASTAVDFSGGLILDTFEGLSTGTLLNLTDTFAVDFDETTITTLDFH